MRDGESQPPGGTDQTADSTGEMGTSAASGGDRLAVLVELRVPRTAGIAGILVGLQGVAVDALGFELDTTYTPVPATPSADARRGLLATDEQVMVVRGTIDRTRLAELEAQPNVLRVWRDAPIAPFLTAEPVGTQGVERRAFVAPVPDFGVCPIGTCDCAPGLAKGTLEDVARYLGAEQLWSRGIKGCGIVIGIVDGGIAAAGRAVRAGEVARVPRVLGGWPSEDWGTTAGAWQDHGNMTATDALGLAPEAHVYDIRISDGATVSTALAGFQWAIDRHRLDGTPHILSNSWGLYQASWEPEYASDPNHPFTRKVVEAIDEGILVLFAAGNCGGSCPSQNCGTDVGPGRSIWGANGHARVMTVGAANTYGQLAGYSSQGPAAMDASKPDFCSITHFKGYFASDTGTSAATPVAAGVVALLKQAIPSLDQEQAKHALKATAADIGTTGWNQHSGSGIIHAQAAYELLTSNRPPAPSPRPGELVWEPLGGACLSAPSAANSGASDLQVFVLGPDHAVYRRARAATVWSDWESLGGTSVEAPAAACSAAGQAHVFAIGMDAGVYWKASDGAGWSGWQPIGGTRARGLAAVPGLGGRLECFTVGVDSCLYWNVSNGPSWRGWVPLGGTCAGGPCAVAAGVDRVHVFVVGVDGRVYHRQREGANWSGWSSLGGACRYGVAAAASADDWLECFAVGLDGALYRTTRERETWSPWQALGGSWVAAPAAATLDVDHVNLLTVGATGGLFSAVLNR